MDTPSKRMVIAGVVALLVLVAGSAFAGESAGANAPISVSILGGIHALNKNDTALPDQLLDIPLAGAVSYDLNPNWAVEGELTWLIPLKQSVDLGAAGTQDRKSPDILAYQASVLGKLPVSGTPWTPYLVAGLGGVSFLSNTDADRLPQLADTQNAFAINFGAGTTYGLGSHWALRADYREFGAFPPSDAKGLSNGNKADPIWMERGTVGLAYRF